jgi:hypothetical protein
MSPPVAKGCGVGVMLSGASWPRPGNSRARTGGRCISFVVTVAALAQNERAHKKKRGPERTEEEQPARR